MKFSELNLNEKLVSALNSIGFEETTEIQEKTIPLIMGGKDVVARSQTGSGKTLAFGLPIIHNVDRDQNAVQALVICPTRELAMQVAAECRKATTYLESIKIVPIYGGADIRNQIKSLKDAKIVIGTPGRIMDHMKRKTLKLENIRTLVLDEADEMLNMGFKEDIEKIIKSTNRERQTLMFSATYPPAIQAITKNYQNYPVIIEVGELNRSLTNIKQEFLFVDKKKKIEALLEQFASKKPKLSIIFSNTKIYAELVKDKLVEAGYAAIALHGDMRQRERTRVLKALKNGESNILVATDVAARGIDIDNVDYIFNFDLPVIVEPFLHRIGRTARAGKSGNAISFITSAAEYRLLKEFEKETKSDIKELAFGDYELASVKFARVNLSKIAKPISDFSKKRGYNKSSGEKEKIRNSNKFSGRREDNRRSFNDRKNNVSDDNNDKKSKFFDKSGRASRMNSSNNKFASVNKNENKGKFSSNWGENDIKHSRQNDDKPTRKPKDNKYTFENTENKRRNTFIIRDRGKDGTLNMDSGNRAKSPSKTKHDKYNNLSSGNKQKEERNVYTNNNDLKKSTSNKFNNERGKSSDASLKNRKPVENRSNRTNDSFGKKDNKTKTPVGKFDTYNKKPLKVKRIIF